MTAPLTEDELVAKGAEALADAGFVLHLKDDPAFCRRLASALIHKLKVRELREAAEPIVEFIDKFDAKPIRMHDEFYAIHVGTEWEARLRLSDFARLRSALALTEESPRG